MTAFYLKCMGIPELRAPDGRVVKMRGRKHLALLTYLAVERRGQYRRDELAHFLWSDAPTAEARHSLATGASAIRRALGPDALEGSRELLRLRHDRIRLDLDRLETGELFATPELPELEVDGFLQGYDIREAQEYMHWRDRQRARWLPAIIRALLRLIDHSRRTGASRSVGTLADRLLGLDELSEDGIRAKIEALAFAGDRIAALRVFEEWRERLHADLGAVPSPLLEEMARRLRRRGLERPVADSAPTVQTDPWRDRPFVGRANEYRQLYEGWESASKGAPRHMLVEGESGIGKSTLVERFSMAAALEGAVVSRVQCYELERAIPFAAVAALVAGLVDKPGVSATEPLALAEVARVVPKVRERFPGLPAPRDSQGETARLHFAEGILAMLEAAMEEHPVILLVDDFHLADEVSLTVLHLLIRRVEAGRLMVVLTMRTSELEPASGAARIHGGGEYLRMGKMRLPPLSETESIELLAGLVPKEMDPPSPPIRHMLLQASRGVPMVLQLLVQDWQRQGSDSLALAIRSMRAQLGAGGSATPEGAYRHIVERVLGDLDGVTRLVLQAATVFGSRINDLALYQVADLTPSQVMMGMAELTQRHILRDSVTGLDFVNELVRGQAYSAMPGALRQALHGAVARHLLVRLASGEEVVRGLETAWHLVRGGRVPEAAPHLLRGAREAISEGAPHEAELALGSALEEPGLLDGTSRNESLLLLSEVRQELSQWAASEPPLKALAGDLSVNQRERAVLLSLTARRHHSQRDHWAVPDLVRELLQVAHDFVTPAVRANAIALAAGTMDETHSLEFSPALSAAIELIEPFCLAPDERVSLLAARAALHYHARNTNLGLNDATTAIELLQSSGNHSSVFVSLVLGVSAIACADGRYPDALASAELAYGLASRLDHDRLMIRSAGNAALANGRLGRYEEQERWGRLKLRRLGPASFDAERLRTGWMIGMAEAMLGRQNAVETFRECCAIIGSDSAPWIHQTILLMSADLHMMLGKPRLALRWGKEATTGKNAGLLSHAYAGIYARWIALTGRAFGEELRARNEIQKLMLDRAKFDVIDRVEILCALSALGGDFPELGESSSERLRIELSALPEAVAVQLQRLGVLDQGAQDRG